MPTRIGLLSSAHLHAAGYISALRRIEGCEFVGLWDDDVARAREFAAKWGGEVFAQPSDLLSQCEAVIVASENRKHADHVALAAEFGLPSLCEKPLVATRDERDRMFEAVDRGGTWVMTAFPTRFSPAFQRLLQRVRADEIGPIVGICATNRGTCPLGWFVETAQSGGGAAIDHVVHVADLLSVLTGRLPRRVTSFMANRMYGESWEDSALLTMEYVDGLFATLDSSWSRPKSYKTWGDVTMNVVGERGVIELDMFNQGFDVFTNTDMRHGLAGYGSDLDAGLVDDFLNCIEEDTTPAISGEDGWRAVQVALAGYESVRLGGEAVSVR